MSDMYDNDEFTDFDFDFEQEENPKVVMNLRVEVHPSDLKRLNKFAFLNGITLEQLTSNLLEENVEYITALETHETIKKRNNRCLT
jgi:hypothetical protein